MLELELTMTTDVSRVFFSYARADAEFVLTLANGLRAAGIGLWIDQLDIAAGDRWDSAVEDALKASPCILVVLSPASVASQNVMDEVAFALAANKRVVPVIHTRCDIPFRMQRLQHIDFTAGYDSAFTQLVSVLGGVSAAPLAQSPEVPARAESPDQAASGTTASGPQRMYPLAAAVLVTVLGVSYWALSGEGQVKQETPAVVTSGTPTTIRSRVEKAGGTLGAQRSPQLDHQETFATTGALKMEFELSRGACSKARLHIFIDGKPVKQTDYFDDTTGILDLGPVTSGRHTLTLSPEGQEGGCNSGTLGSWGGTLTLHIDA